MQDRLDINRYQALRPRFFWDYFNKLKEAWKKYNIHPRDCYNMDKTGFRIGVRGKPKIVTCNARWLGSAPSSTYCDFVTVVECVSTDKSIISLFIILPRKNLMEAWVIITDLPDEFLVAVSDPKYSNDELLLHWLEQFDKHSAQRQEGQYRKLIMDWYGSYWTVDFIDYCKKIKIIRFGLPPH